MRLILGRATSITFRMGLLRPDAAGILLAAAIAILPGVAAEGLGPRLDLLEKALDPEVEIDLDATLEAVAALGQAGADSPDRDRIVQTMVQWIERQQPVRTSGRSSRIPALMLIKSAMVAAAHQVGDKRVLGVLKAFQVKEGKTKYFPEDAVEQAIAALSHLPGEESLQPGGPGAEQSPDAWHGRWEKTEEGRRFLQLASVMAEGSHAEKQAARDALMRSGNPVVPFLVDCLHHHPHFVGRRSSAYLLGQINDPLTVPDLVHALEEKDDNVLWTILTSLGFMEDRRATERVIPFLDHPVERIRVAAAQALVRLRDPRSIEALAAHIRKYAGGIHRARAAEALGEIGDRRALPMLLETMRDKHLVTREHAAMAYGKVAQEADLEVLLKKLESGELAAQEVRMAFEEHFEADLQLEDKDAPAEQVAAIRQQVQEVKEGKTVSIRPVEKSATEQELEEGPLE
ncbi:MAG: HEAT repeat domain-containing protein [Planctomycetes bacterium]|nr:HEAT repeat domain-containing protein [Planctomycetota bacterium]